MFVARRATGSRTSRRRRTARSTAPRCSSMDIAVRVGVSGYLNLKDPITPAQRVLAGNLIASTLGIATNPKALAKATNCRYLDAEYRRAPAAGGRHVDDRARRQQLRRVCRQQRHHRGNRQGLARLGAGRAHLEERRVLGRHAVESRQRRGHRVSLPHGQSARGGGRRDRQPMGPGSLRARRGTFRWRSGSAGGIGAASLRAGNGPDQNRYTAAARIDLRSPIPPSRRT